MEMPVESVVLSSVVTAPPLTSVEGRISFLIDRYPFDERQKLDDDPDKVLDFILFFWECLRISGLRRASPFLKKFPMEFICDSDEENQIISYIRENGPSIIVEGLSNPENNLKIYLFSLKF